ncbi:hypothetical protein QQ045_012857 [Rhodiola kirilowii]
MATIRQAFYLMKSWNLSRFRRAYFCSASSGSSERRRCFYPDEEGESAVYKHAMKFQRPSVMKWSNRLTKLENQVSLIGSVLWPLTVYELKGGPFEGRFIASTKLDAKARDTSSSFRIILQFRDELGRMCSQHLKPKDYIYVSGQLERFVDQKSVKRYKVIVKELNYVTRRGEISPSPNYYQSESRGETPSEKRKNRLHLWQLFFANPQEWWDNRKDKRNPRAPDFKHKDTGEVLWLPSPDDPPWVATQLQLQDSRMANYNPMRSRYSDTRPGLSKWAPDDLI